MTWANWAGNQQCAPAAVEHPGSEEELAHVVKRAASEGRTVKAVGAGHSFTDIACTDGVQLQLDRYGDLVEADRATGRVTVEAGMTLGRLNDALWDMGLALPNLGDIAYQSVAGAISTSTHGTGLKLGGLATQVVGLRLVTGDGSVLSASAEEDPDLFAAARVGLGAVGLLSTVTLQTVPQFNLRAVEEPMRMDTVLRDIDRHAEDNDHFEFYWVPHTGWALTKRNNRTDDPVGGRSRAREFVDRTLLENVAFGAVCRVGRWRPSLIPRLSKALPSSGRTEYVNRSYRVFTSPRYVHFYEMEYSVPRDAVPDALRQLVRWVESSGLRLNFPVEVRFTAADDIWLSTAHGGERGYIAVHVYQGMPYEQYFRGVEAIMGPLGGRPHWGKLHYQTAESLAPRYPAWDRFQAVRGRTDPEGRFANAYLTRVLGPP
ncbi:MAG TPA: D-arabinono-1,4-lactone oxidase [Acidimicrobiales bacterium]|jgi:L-gulonolactone oxidase|nr:D-arabinono-1,4-lactone oxidase [Acidimicrobiales bacterium]